MRYASTLSLALITLPCVKAQCSIIGMTTVGAEASQLGSCSTFLGSIALATDAPETVDFGDWGSIQGDLVANQAENLATLTGDSIIAITGTFEMKNLMNFFTLNMQNLRGVGQGSRGGISWSNLPLFQSVNLGSGLQYCPSLHVADTQIQDLSAIDITEGSDFFVGDNPALSLINWQLTNCTNLTIVHNGLITNGVNITLNQLQGLADLSITNASELAFPMLEQASGVLSMDGVNSGEVTFPNLTSVGNIRIADCRDLTSLSLPALKTSQGSVEIFSNDQIDGLLAFPNLTQIQGDLNISGAYSGVSMPALEDITGSSYLWSTQNMDQTCDQFGPSGSYANKIQGDSIVCEGDTNVAPAATPQPANDTNRSGSPNSPSNGSQASSTNTGNNPHLSAGGIAGIVVGVICFCTAVLVVVLILRKRQSRRRATRSNLQDAARYEKAELPSGTSSTWYNKILRKHPAELAARDEAAHRSELPASQPEPVELPSERHPREVGAEHD